MNLRPSSLGQAKVSNTALPSLFRSLCRPAAEVPWGDGLLDQSSLWYPCRWDDVAADELVLLIPSLAQCGGSPSGSATAGPAVHIRSALLQQLAATALILFSQTDRWQVNGPRTHRAALDTLRSCDVVTSLSNQDWDGIARPSDGCALNRKRKTPVTAEGMAYELSVLACLDQMHADCLPGTARAGHLSAPGSSVSLADALVCSIHARINAAYVYPQFAFAHELLTTGAWIGQLIEGRPALMPTFVAESLADYLSNGDEPVVGHLLHHYAGLSGGAAWLLGAARRAIKTRRPMLVRPGRAGDLSSFGSVVWNQDLLERMPLVMRRFDWMARDHAC